MDKSPRLHSNAHSPAAAPPNSGMYSDTDCGVCYRTYNAGRRCPRELHCKHTFCESCLLALSRPPRPEGGDPGADRLILCPLCRHATAISGEGRKLRAELRVDECALERLVAAGVLDQEEDDDPEEEEESGQAVEEGAALPGSSARQSDSAAGSGRGRLRRSWRRLWRLIVGKDTGQETEIGCLTDDDFSSLAIMSSLF